MKLAVSYVLQDFIVNKNITSTNSRAYIVLEIVSFMKEGQDEEAIKD